jgi:surface antigen
VLRRSKRALPLARNGRPRRPTRAAVIIAVLALAPLATLVVGVQPASAGTDDYPTSIAGCRDAAHPNNPPFTCNLKGSAKDSLIDPWNEYNRECTSFVAWRLHARNGFEMPFNDDAGGWGPDASSRGYTVNSTAAVGAVAWYNATAKPPYGHVAWVESISGQTITVEQYNIGNNGTYSESTIATLGTPSGYIHFKDAPTGGGGTANPNRSDVDKNGASDMVLTTNEPGGGSAATVLKSTWSGFWLQSPPWWSDSGTGWSRGHPAHGRRER